MSKELKKYGLRATRRPAKCDTVATTVVVRNEAGETGYCYIGFDEPFVHRVGTKLPRGVGTHDPAFISVRYYPRTKVWLVVAQYMAGGEEVLLWKTPTRPEWLNFYRTKHHGSDTKARNSDSPSQGRA
jgi:hypothetical protein